MNNFLLLYCRSFYLTIISYIIKFFLLLKGIKVGKNFKCEAFPNITLNKKSKFIIGDNFYLCSNVEFRVLEGSAIQIGNDCKIDRGSRLISCNNSIIKIDEGTVIGCYSIVNAGEDILIGKKCLISGFVYLQSSSHGKKINYYIRDQKHSYGKIVIEDDVWIGAHSVVLKNIKLKKGCVVGANSVVNLNCESNTIYAGNPAKELAKRK